MMKPEKFRIASLLLAVLLGWFAIATIFGEAFTPAVSRSSPYRTPLRPELHRLQSWTATAAPLRGDIRGDYAMALAARVLSPGKEVASDEKAVARNEALALARQSLSLAPHASDVWLSLAMLQDLDPTQSSAEALKMSYLTSPADVVLIPTRLAVLSASSAIADVELRDLARGDIRLILTRRPDLRGSIIEAYRRGSPEGRAYVEEVVRAIDPVFAASLR
jgi:hypothetical protein